MHNGSVKKRVEPNIKETKTGSVKRKKGYK